MGAQQLLPACSSDIKGSGLMPRPPMPPGSWGKIRVTRTESGTLEASARYVYFSGRVARIRARGHSTQAARTALLRKLQELNGAEAAEGDLTPSDDGGRTGRLLAAGEGDAASQLELAQGLSQHGEEPGRARDRRATPRATAGRASSTASSRTGGPRLQPHHAPQGSPWNVRRRRPARRHGVEPGQRGRAHLATSQGDRVSRHGPDPGRARPHRGVDRQEASRAAADQTTSRTPSISSSVPAVASARRAR